MPRHHKMQGRLTKDLQFVQTLYREKFFGNFYYEFIIRTSYCEEILQKNLLRRWSKRPRLTRRIITEAHLIILSDSLIATDLDCSASWKFQVEIDLLTSSALLMQSFGGKWSLGEYFDVILKFWSADDWSGGFGLQSLDSRLWSILDPAGWSLPGTKRRQTTKWPAFRSVGNGVAVHHTLIAEGHPLDGLLIWSFRNNLLQLF